METKRRIEVMVCEYCGKEFIPKTKTQKFCSNLNYGKCAFCGRVFEYRCKKPKKYCSRACNYKDAGRRTVDEVFKKYGVRSSLSLKRVKQKAERTMREKYGANNYFATDKFKEQQKNIFLKKYNGHPMKIQKYKNKQKETCKFKYGVSNISKLLETKQKIITTCTSKYGVTNVSKVKEFIESRVKNTDFKKLQEKRRKTLLEKTGYSENFSDPKCRLLIAKTNMRRYNTPFPVVFGKQAISKINRSFSESLLRANLSHKMEYRLNNFIYDFLVEDGKILVDINLLQFLTILQFLMLVCFINVKASVAIRRYLLTIIKIG